MARVACSLEPDWKRPITSSGRAGLWLSKVFSPLRRSPPMTSGASPPSSARTAASAFSNAWRWSAIEKSTYVVGEYSGKALSSTGSMVRAAAGFIASSEGIVCSNGKICSQFRTRGETIQGDEPCANFARTQHLVRQEWPLHKGRRVMRTVILALALIGVVTGAAHAAEPDTSAAGAIGAQAVKLQSLVRSTAVKAFLDSTAALPNPGTRTIHFDSSRTHFYTDSEYKALADTARARLVTRKLDDGFYYNTRYGTPLGYARALDLVAAQGVKSFAGERIVDFGYGGIGHLRLLATVGADMTGIEVDPLLPVLYGEPGDQGSIPGKNGRITLVNGRFPAEPCIVEKVGAVYDLFLSKNSLKHDYIHPQRPADERQLVHLGVEDSAFVAAVAALLKPGGLVMIYNLSPAPSKPDEPYRPWSDGHDPFPRALWESSGFEVIAYDQTDDAAAREMAHALGWDEGANKMDLANDLFAHYTMVRKKGK